MYYRSRGIRKAREGAGEGGIRRGLGNEGEMRGGKGGGGGRRGGGGLLRLGH